MGEYKQKLFMKSLDIIFMGCKSFSLVIFRMNARLNINKSNKFIIFQTLTKYFLLFIKMSFKGKKDLEKIFILNFLKIFNAVE
jgi:hypothetical protein